MSNVDSLKSGNPAEQHKALTATEQSVIKKLFRRLIIFLFVWFLFSRSLTASTSGLPV
ncbi:Uncharacterised protein [Serratia fonticola]|uniref:Uncharacterized protein n=1 Tax=Serratia fonticola TaxID=47917 RepID=A0A4U9VQE8_SERFO|nr:Uncharacterised protein [Serratia fonticola]